MLVPPPDPHTTTAAQAALWYTEEALYLYGRADRRKELHGERDTIRGHLLALAKARTETACVLRALAEQRGEEAVSEVLAVAMAEDPVSHERAAHLGTRSGTDPQKAYVRGYSS